MQFNCNGVWPRLTELRARLASERPHLVLLQETKLRAGQEAPAFPGYNVAARQDWTPPPDPGPAADRPEPPAPAPPTPTTPPPPPPQDPAETLAAAEAATATGGTTGSRAVAPVRGELPGDERAREKRLDPPPRGRLPRACRTAQPDRTRWCRGCRSHRGWDLRRPTAATTTVTQDAATVGEPGTPTASLAEESRPSGDPVPTTEREGDRPRGTTCRALFREERDRWCGGCRRQKRCERREVLPATAISAASPPTPRPPEQAATGPPSSLPSPGVGTTTGIFGLAVRQRGAPGPVARRQTQPRDASPAVQSATAAPAACRTRLKDDRASWCRGCRSKRRCEVRAGGTLPPDALCPAPAAPTDDPTSTGSGDAGAGGQDGATGAEPASDPGEESSGRRARPRRAAAAPPFSPRGQGGVMTLVRDDLPYSVNPSPYRPTQPDHNTYCISVTVHASRALDLMVINVYAPPARWTAGQGTQEQGFQPVGIRLVHPAVVCGDFNAHSLSWDPHQPETALGEAIEDWAVDNGLAILNDGAHTRQNPSTGGVSAPDVAMTSRTLLRSRDVTWATQRGLGSDHLPILVTMSSSVQRPRREGRGRFSHRSADWSQFRAKLDQLIDAWSAQPSSLSEAANRLAATILQAARATIPFGNGRGRRPPF